MVFFQTNYFLEIENLNIVFENLSIVKSKKIEMLFLQTRIRTKETIDHDNNYKSNQDVVPSV